jgi:hypothetical protein
MAKQYLSGCDQGFARLFYERDRTKTAGGSTKAENGALNAAT